MMSLIATGTPCSGPREWRCARRSSSARAWASACSRSGWTNALLSPAGASVPASQERASSSAGMAPLAISPAASVPVSDASPSSAMALLQRLRRSAFPHDGREIIVSTVGSAGCLLRERPLARYLTSAAIEIVRQPESHTGPEVHDDHAQDDDHHVRHH